jgi:hypothetical protein
MNDAAEPRSHYDLIAYAATIGYPDALARDFSSWASLMNSDVPNGRLRELFEIMSPAWRRHIGTAGFPQLPTTLYSVVAPPNDESYPVVLQPNAGDGGPVWVEGTKVIAHERVADRLEHGWRLVVHDGPSEVRANTEPCGLRAPNGPCTLPAGHPRVDDSEWSHSREFRDADQVHKETLIELGQAHGLTYSMASKLRKAILAAGFTATLR